MSKNDLSKCMSIVSIFIYGLVSYLALLWWLTPLFFFVLASLFFKWSMQPRFLYVWAWSLCLSCITFFPCLWMATQFCKDLWVIFIVDSLMIVFGAGFFLCVAWCALMIKKNAPNNYVPLCAFVLANGVAWWFIDIHFFWWIAPGYGYMLANPILPLCVDARLIALAPYIGTYGMMTLMALGAGGAAQWVYLRIKSGMVIALGVAVVFWLGSLLVPCTKRPLIANRIVVLDAEGLKKRLFLEILGMIKERCALCSDCDLIVGPESLVAYPLNQAVSACNMFDDVYAAKSPTILFGAQRKTDDGLYNSAYCVQQGRITYYYDKTTLLPFFEQSILTCWFSKDLQGFFNLRGKCGYCSGSQSPETTKTTLFLGDRIYPVRVCLCSDLFCGRIHPPCSGFVVALVNDEWFFGSCMADRMLWFAVLWAARQCTPVIYVGYSQAVFIESSGRQWPLVRVGEKGLFLP